MGSKPPRCRSRVERIFIDANDIDWPKELHARLGFDRLGREWRFIRPPAESPA
jgi:hypothetical protein